MNIKNIVVGELKTNCYIIEKDNNILIIDPGDNGDQIIKNINPDKRVIGILITHSHFDHIGAIEMIKDKYRCPIYNHNNLDEGSHSIDNFNFKVIYTPGHKDDLITFYFEKESVMFVGDFIFKGGIGRVDFPESNPEDMKRSIKKILKYPEDTVIYPGHFGKTTLKEEKKVLLYYSSII